MAVHIPMLPCVDNFGILARSLQELQQLLDICAMNMNERCLVFNLDKCVAMVCGLGRNLQLLAGAYRLAQ